MIGSGLLVFVQIRCVLRWWSVDSNRFWQDADMFRNLYFDFSSVWNRIEWWSMILCNSKMKKALHQNCFHALWWYEWLAVGIAYDIMGFELCGAKIFESPFKTFWLILPKLYRAWGGEVRNFLDWCERTKCHVCCFYWFVMCCKLVDLGTEYVIWAFELLCGKNFNGILVSFLVCYYVNSLGGLVW